MEVAAVDNAYHESLMVAHRAPGPCGIWLDPQPIRLNRVPHSSSLTAEPGEDGPVPDKPMKKSARDLDGVHVLIVEDTDDSREVLRLTLQSCGALVTSVATAKEAESLLRELRPHILVTDITMPDDGITLIRAVRAMATAQGIRVPTVAITAARGRSAELLAEGFVEVLQKPLDPIELCRSIRRHLPRFVSEVAE